MGLDHVFRQQNCEQSSKCPQSRNFGNFPGLARRVPQEQFTEIPIFGNYLEWRIATLTPFRSLRCIIPEAWKAYTTKSEHLHLWLLWPWCCPSR
jgi:hypothetical protein